VVSLVVTGGSLTRRPKRSIPPKMVATVVVGGPCDAMRSGIGMTITFPGHPMSVTPHYFNHE